MNKGILQKGEEAEKLQNYALPFNLQMTLTLNFGTPIYRTSQHGKSSLALESSGGHKNVTKCFVSTFVLDEFLHSQAVRSAHLEFPVVELPSRAVVVPEVGLDADAASGEDGTDFLARRHELLLLHLGKAGRHATRHDHHLDSGNIIF